MGSSSIRLASFWVCLASSRVRYGDRLGGKATGARKASVRNEEGQWDPRGECSTIDGTDLPPTLLYLVRHGETEWNVERRWQSQLDIPLNETGRRQARELARSAGAWRLDALYTSDLARAAETARVLVGASGGGASGVSPVPVYLEPRLREHDAGLLTGLTLEEVRTQYADWWRENALDPANTRTPGGEAFAEVRARAVAAVEEIAGKHAGGRVGLVSHGGPLKGVIYEVLGASGHDPDLLRLDNCSLTVVQWRPRRRLLAMNVTPGWFEDKAPRSGELE